MTFNKVSNIITTLKLIATTLLLGFTVTAVQAESSIKPEGYAEIRVNSNAINIEQRLTAYAFKWTADGNFEYSWDNKTWLQPELMHDNFNPAKADYYLFSELLFDFGDKIYFRNVKASEITLILIDGSEGQSDVVITKSQSAGGQVNQSSGNMYSQIGIKSRKVWGADERFVDWDPDYRRIDKIIIHHTAWPGRGSHAETVRSIYLYHAISQDWGDIGYNYLIAPDGTIYEGRKGGEGVIGAHAYNANAGSIGISMMGTFTDNLPTDAAIRALRRLMVEKALIHGISLQFNGANRTVFGHRNMEDNITACPGQRLYNSLGVITEDAEEERLAQLPTSNIDIQRTASKAVMNTYRDHRLELTFANTGLTLAQKQALVPAGTGIIKKEFNGNKVLLTFDSRTYYYDRMYHDTYERTRMSHIIFSLDPNFSAVSTVSLPVESTILYPSNGIGYFRGMDLAISFTKPMAKGTGLIRIRDYDTDEIVHSFDVTTAAIGISLHFPQQVDIHLPAELPIDKKYYVTICSTCLETVDNEAFAGISNKDEWSFSTAVPPTGVPLYRFYSFRRRHYYTISATEKDKIIAQDPNWDYERIEFNVMPWDKVTGCPAGTVPVYSFWSDNFFGHFYTTSEAEKDKLINTDPNWRYLKVAFCSFNSQQEYTIPVYRFYSPTYKSHFFTASLDEKNKLMAYESHNWKFERIEYYALPKEEE